MKYKVVATSDTHGNLPEIPPCDIFIHAGDMCPLYDHATSYQKLWIEGIFNRWVKCIDAKWKFIIPGNHDFIYDDKKFVANQNFYQEKEQDLDGYINYRNTGRILIDEGYLIKDLSDGKELSVYGTPWQPVFYNWAFNLTEDELCGKFQRIPNDLDILISHGPPYGCADRTLCGDRIGSFALREAIELKKPKILICGHNHAGYGNGYIKDTEVYNVSYLTENCRNVNGIVEFTYEK